MKKNEIIKKIIYILFLLPFFRPRSVAVFFPKLNYIVYTIFPIIVLCIVLMFCIKNKCFSKITIYIYGLMLILFMTTILNNGDLEETIKIIINVIGLSMLIDFGIKKDTKLFLESANIFFVILITINLITMILYPNGMYIDSSNYTDNWFLGYRNIHILFILPAIVINIIKSYYLNNTITKKCFFFLVTCFISMIMARSGTATIGVFLILFLIIIYKKAKYFNIKKYTIASLVANICIVILRIQEIFKYIIVDIMHKNLTLTGRIYIWDDVENLILKKPFFGYGQEFKNIRLLKTKLPSYHAHNQLLEITYKTGFIGLFLFLIIVFSCTKKLYKFKDYNISKTLSICLFSILIMMITEAYVFNNFLYLFVIFYNIDVFVKIRGEKDEKNI